MTDNNAAKPAETAAGEKKAGPIRQWIKDHPNIWEFILFNVLSNISTITRFVVTWIGTAIFISGLGLTQPFHFLIFNYDTKGNGLGGFLTFLLAEVLAQVVNFFVQMKWVFKSDSSFKDAAWKYVILAVIIVFIVVLWPIFDPSGTHVLWQWGWLKLTRENLVMAAVMGLRIPALGFACFLTFVHHQPDQADPRAHLPGHAVQGRTHARHRAALHSGVLLHLPIRIGRATGPRTRPERQERRHRQETQRIRTLGGPVQIVSAHHHRGADPRLQNEPKRRLGYGIARAQPPRRETHLPHTAEDETLRLDHPCGHRRRDGRQHLADAVAVLR